jgi:LAS superfamily LD-carboxypeptidase LdcB
VAVRIIYQSTAGPGKTEGGKPIALHYEEGIYAGGDGDLVFPKDNLGGFTKARNRAPLFYKMITGGSLPADPNIPAAPITPPTTDGVQTATVSSPNTTTPSNDPVAQESSKGNNDEKNEDNPQKVDEVTPGLSNIFPPTIKVEPIKIKHKGEDKEFLKEWSSDIGTRPFIWYNSYQIDDKDIEYFALYHDGLLPTLTLTFKDSMNLMKDKGFPLDDTKIKIFLSSRTKNIRHILLEFKIANFSVNGDIYTIKGVLNVNGLHLRKFKSYSKKTSFFALQDICKEVGLGFNSNITDSKDQMTWINTGQKVYDFMDEILSYSYISDEGFSYGYVDFFYNFNYVDIEKELSRDASEDKGVDSSGFGKDAAADDKKIKRVSLSNDRSLQESDSYVSEYKILNNSTSVSLEKGYLNVSKYYDSVKKEYLIFDVDSITSEGNTSIIMKGSPQDETFYKENVNTTYVGKLDPDNAHINYNYSYVHNSQNIDDLQKIGIKLTLPNPNYNLYRFQKVVVLITNKGKTPSANIKNDRISGDWFITEIKFIYSEGSYSQEISLIKRELEVSNVEFEEEQMATTSANETEPPKNNTVEKTTNPSDLTNTDAPVAADSYNPGTTKAGTSGTPANQPPPSPSKDPVVVKNDTTPPIPGKYNLDYLVLDDVTKNKLKSNDGRIFNLVLVDGKVTTDFVANAYLDMKAAAKKESIELSISSGFRPAYGPEVTGKTKSGKTFNVTTQEYLYNGWIAKKPGFNLAAKPGRSNHGNGIALDLNTGSRGKKSLTEARYKWLVMNSWKFGFVREVYNEEWHFDYLPDLAKKGPYGKLPSNGGKNLYFADLGLDNIKIA